MLPFIKSPLLLQSSFTVINKKRDLMIQTKFSSSKRQLRDFLKRNKKIYACLNQENTELFYFIIYFYFISVSLYHSSFMYTIKYPAEFLSKSRRCWKLVSDFGGWWQKIAVLQWSSNLAREMHFPAEFSSNPD